MLHKLSSRARTPSRQIFTTTNVTKSTQYGGSSSSSAKPPSGQRSSFSTNIKDTSSSSGKTGNTGGNSGSGSNSSSNPGNDPANAGLMSNPKLLSQLGMGLSIPGWALAGWYVKEQSSSQQEAVETKEKLQKLKTKKSSLSNKNEELSKEKKKMEETTRKEKVLVDEEKKKEKDVAGDLKKIKEEMNDYNLTLGLIRKANSGIEDIVDTTISEDNVGIERKHVVKERILSKKLTEGRGGVNKEETPEEYEDRERKEFADLKKKSLLSKVERAVERQEERVKYTRGELEKVLGFCSENPRFLNHLKDKLERYEREEKGLKDQIEKCNKEKGITAGKNKNEEMYDYRIPSETPVELINRVKEVINETEGKWDALELLDKAVYAKDKKKTVEAIRKCSELGLTITANHLMNKPTLNNLNGPNGSDVASGNEVEIDSLGCLGTLADVLLSAEKMLNTRLRTNADLLEYVQFTRRGGSAPTSPNNGKEHHFDSAFSSDFHHNTDDGFNDHSSTLLHIHEESEEHLKTLHKEELLKFLLEKTEQLAHNEKFSSVRIADELQSFTESFETRVADRVKIASEMLEYEVFSKEKELLEDNLSAELTEVYDHQKERWLVKQGRTLGLSKQVDVMESSEKCNGNVVNLKEKFFKEMEDLGRDFTAVGRVLEEDSNAIKRMKRIRKCHTLVEAAIVRFERERRPLKEVMGELCENLKKLQIDGSNTGKGSDTGAESAGGKGGNSSPKNSPKSPTSNNISLSASEISFSNLCNLAEVGLKSSGTVTYGRESDSTCCYVNAGESLQYFNNEFCQWRTAVFVQNPYSIWSHIWGNVAGRVFLFDDTELDEKKIGGIPGLTGAGPGGGGKGSGSTPSSPLSLGLYKDKSVVDQGLYCLHQAKKSIEQAKLATLAEKDMILNGNGNIEDETDGVLKKPAHDYLTDAVLHLDRIPIQCGLLKRRTEGWVGGTREYLVGRQVFSGLRSQVKVMQGEAKLIEGPR